MKLKKAAQLVYRDLPATAKEDYELLKNAMSVRFSSSKQTDLHKTELRLVKRHSGEKLTELANRIRHLASLAYPMIDAEFRDELCRDQFIETLQDREIRLKTRQP